jgi:uncharacterized tellurite resistance protein B-like protein
MIDWIKRIAQVVLEPSMPVALTAMDLAQLKQAVAALLLEMVYADFVTLPEERQAVEASLQRHFDLDPQELSKLIDNADDQARSSLGWSAYLVPVNELMTPAQKQQLLRCLCELALVDSRVHVMENAMLEQVARAMQIAPDELQAIKRQLLAE